MTDQPVVLAVASYPSRAAAELDFHALGAINHAGRVDHLAAAEVEKGANGWLEIARHRSTGLPGRWGVTLLGSAITAVAAPLGITLLASVLATGTEWKGAAGIVGRFWHEVPRDRLRAMGNLLEGGQTGVVVVAVDPRADYVKSVLSHATTKIVTDCVRVDLEAGFASAFDEVVPESPTSSPSRDDPRRRIPRP